MTTSPLSRELTVALEAVREAGDLLRQEFHRAGGPRGPSGKCPADNEAEELIRNRLDAAFPEHGQRGEELVARNRPPADDGAHCWLIDPNDGTSSFQKGWRGSSVSLGLLRRGQPVLGVVFAYAARAGQGDLFCWAEGGTFERNGQAIPGPLTEVPLESGTVLISQDADRRSQENANCWAPARFRAVPSVAYRMALAAAGEGLTAISLGHPNDYDVAAGHALLLARGGALWLEDGAPVTYRSDGRGHVDNCWAGEPQATAQMLKRDYRAVFGRQHGEAPEEYRLAWPDARRIVSQAGMLERAQGCLLGQLAGDSLGGLVEFQQPAAIRRRYPDGPCALHDGGYWDLLAGQPTDDSELALMLARSILKEGQYTAEAAAKAYAWWLSSEPFDVGNTTRTALAPALAALHAGEPVAKAAWRAAAGSMSQANGALMRVAPLAIHASTLHEETIAQLAKEDARLTHSHPVCQDANAVFCVAIARAIRHGADRMAVYQHARDWARTHRVHEDVQLALERAAHAPPESYTHQMGWVLIALQNAFYQLLHAPDLRTGIVATVSAGGDTDTNGAIAGALLGAACGAEQIPRQWVDRILTCRPLKNSRGRHPRPAAFWPVDCLIVAEQLLATASP